jgi:hypothetical protein
MATLSELVTLALETCTPSERKSLRSAAKQYAAMLGTDPDHCQPEIYHLPTDERNALIGLKSPPLAGEHAAQP